MECIELFCSLEFELFSMSICSIRIRDRNQDIFKIKLSSLFSNPMNINKCVEELRELAASTIKSNSDDFVGFLESDIDTYCHKVQIIDF